MAGLSIDDVLGELNGQQPDQPQNDTIAAPGYQPPREAQQAPPAAAFDASKPATGLSVDDVGSAISDIQDGQAQRSVFRGVQEDPETYAKDKKTAVRAGLPVDAVRQDRLGVEGRVKTEDVMTAIADAPATKAFLANEDNAKLAHDDAANMSALEKAWKWYTEDYIGTGVDVVQAVPGGALQAVGMTASGWGDIYRSAGRSLARPIYAALEAMGATDVLDALKTPVPWYLDPAEILKRPGEATMRAADATLPEKQGIATNVGLGLGQVAAQITAAVLTGGASSVTSLASLYGQGAYQGAQMVEQGGATGTAAGDAATLLGGAITAVTERYGLDALIKYIPKNVQNKVFQVLAGAGTEGTQEILEQVLNNLTAYTLYDPNQKIVDYSALYQGGVGAAVGGVVSALIGTGSAFNQSLRAARAQRARENLMHANELAKQSKLQARAPEAAAEHQAAVMRAQGVEGIYIDAEAVNQMVENHRQDDPELAGKLGLTEDGLLEAMDSGGDVRLSVDDFARHLYGTDMFNEVVDSMRVKPGEMTAQEAADYRKAGLKEEIDALYRGADALDPQSRGDWSTIQREAEQMLLGAGRAADEAVFGSALLAHEYTTVAERAKVSAVDLWREDNLAIQGPDQGQAPVDNLTVLLDKARSTDPEKFLGLSKTPVLDWLKSKGGVDPQGRLAGELRAIGVTNKTKPGLFKKGGLQTADNLVQQEADLFAGTAAAPEQNGYINPDDIVSAVQDELAGQPRRTARELASLESFTADVNDLNARLDEAGLTINSPDAEIRKALGTAYEQAVYHGTPNVWEAEEGFPHGRPRLDKIGTGEGAQAYGWGLYFAGKKAVAEFYRRALTNQDTIRPDAQAIADHQAEWDRVTAKINPLYAQLEKPRSSVNFDEIQKQLEPLEAERDAIHEKMIEETKKRVRGGRLYTVDIPEDSEYLDWDKPLSEQPEKVQNSIKSIAKRYGGILENVFSVGGVDRLREGVTGEQFYKGLSKQIFESMVPEDRLHLDGRNYEEASKILSAAGIPGIKYLDAMSRGEGEGTSNYVIFDDNLVKILSYEQPAAPGLAPRGSITFDARQTIMRMGEAADRSTFLHESGHLFLEHIKRNAERFGATNPQFVKDWDTVKAWWGDNAASLRDEAIRYAKKQKDDAAITALAKMTDAQVKAFVRQGDLTGRGYEQADTSSPAFKRWFGNSKVVDRDGNPLVVYHGTDQNIDAFDMNAGGTGTLAADARGASFFTSSTDVAEDFVGYIYYTPDGKNVVRRYTVGGNIVPVYLKIENPVIWDMHGNSYSEKWMVDAIKDAKKEKADGIIFTNLRDGSVSTVGPWKKSHIFVVFGPTQIKSAIGNRGTFDPNDPRILYQGANGDLTGEDAQAYLNRAMHEQWARGFEDYLRTGQAPSVALQDAFNRFRAWLVSLYRAVGRRGELDVKFSEPVRQVLDRLLATDEEIALVREQYDLKPLFTSAAEVGMTPKQWEAYQRDVARSVEDAKTRQLKKHLNEIEREQLAWWKEESARMRDNVVAPTVQAEPVYRALYALAKGTNPDGSPIEGGLRPSRLDRKAVVILLENEESAKRLPKVAGTGIIATGKEGGAHPDVIAQMYGFQDGRAMLMAMMNAKPMAEAINDATEARMKAEYGDLTNQAAAVEAAIESVHVDKRGEVLATELNALRASGEKMKAAYVRQWARDKIADMTLDGITPSRFLSLERKWGREAGKLLRAGDRLGAQRAKFRQLANFYMAHEAYRVRDEVNSARKYLRKFTRARATFKNIDADFVDRIKTILQAYELGPRVSPKRAVIGELRAINEWVQQQQEENGAIITLADGVLNADERTHYRDLSLARFRDVVDSVKNLAAQGRQMKTAYIKGENRLIEDMTGEIVARLDLLPQSAREGRKAHEQNPSWFDRRMRGLASFDACLRKIEFLMEKIDGGKMGPAKGYIFQVFADAEAARNDLTKAVSAKVIKAMDGIPKEVQKRFGERIAVPELGRVFRRSDLLMMALNVGNESNYQKMVEGSAKDVTEGAVPWTRDGVEAALRNLSKPEWDFVQTVWDAFEAMYPQVEEIYRRENGRVPDKIERRQVDTPHGTYAGGYFPMMYDPARSTTARDIEARTALEAMQSTVVKGSVNSSMTKARTGFSAPVLLDISALTNHIERTAHFITHYEAVRATRKLLARPEIVRAMTNKLGTEYFDTIKQWVNEIAANGRPPMPLSMPGRIVEAMRTNATVAIMGISYTTMASQLLGYANSVDVLAKNPDGTYSPGKGSLYLLKGMTAYLRHPVDVVRTIFANSGEMRHRLQNTDREIRHGLKKLEGKKGIWKSMQNAALLGIAGVQLYMVDVPTWIGSYNKALDEGYGPEDAVRYADSAVRTSQTAGGLKDLAAIQRERGVMTGLTMFYSYFNLLYNLQAETAGNVRKPADVAQAAARMMILLAIPTALEAMMRNEWPKDDQDYLTWLSLKTAVYGSTSVPFLRDLAGVADGFGYSLSPLDSFGQSLSRSVVGIARDFDEGKVTKATIKSLLGTFGFGFGAPVTALNRMIDTADAMWGGEDVNAYDFLIGHYKKK